MVGPVLDVEDTAKENVLAQAALELVLINAQADAEEAVKINVVLVAQDVLVDAVVNVLDALVDVQEIVRVDALLLVLLALVAANQNAQVALDALQLAPVNVQAPLAKVDVREIVKVDVLLLVLHVLAVVILLANTLV